MFIYRAYSIYKSVKMAASTKEDEITFHRKVQQRLADRYLDAIDKKDEESKQMKQRQGSINYSGNQPKSNQRFSLPNILWLIASIGVFRFTEFYLVILYDPRIDSVIKGLWPVWGLLTPFILGTVFMGIVILITMFG